LIGIVDYGLGNVRAFANMYRQLDVPFVIASRAEHLRTVTKAILPGVGAFDQAMHRLETSGMLEPLNELALGRRLPVLGVCVGMQILMESSEEGVKPGLGWVKGDVTRFEPPADSPRMQIPHMGWNSMRPVGDDALFRGLDETCSFYFLHSYLVRCASDHDVSGTTTYGGEFASAVTHGNIRGVQFHPEKSHGDGIQLLRNFAEM